MKVGLFIPCYVNAVFPEVGIASYKLLTSLGCEVDYPEKQTCCGQPMGNAGFNKKSAVLAAKFEEVFSGYDYIVAPSASCVQFVRDHYDNLLGEESHAARHIYEICEFVHDILRPGHIDASFHHKVSLQNSCHGVRLTLLSSPTELNIPYFNKLKNLLSMVDGIEILEPERADECCGFGGMFAVEEHDVSGQMGRDKVMRHKATGAKYIVGADCSCFMHQRGIIEREGLDLQTRHVVEILTSHE